MNEDHKPWVTIYNQWGDTEGTIKGNREGLELLKEKIDEALDEGRSSVEGLDFDFLDVEVKKEKFEEENTPNKPWEAVAQLGCLIIAALIVLTFFMGVWKVAELF